MTSLLRGLEIPAWEDVSRYWGVESREEKTRVLENCLLQGLARVLMGKRDG